MKVVFKKEDLKIILISLLFLVIINLIVGCIPFKDKKSQKRYGNARTIVYYTKNPFKDSQKFINKYQTALKQIQPKDGKYYSVLNTNLLWAIANLDSFKDAFSAKYFSDLIQSRGVVPQALVPQVRKEIQNNPILRFLMSTSSSGVANFGSWLMNLFMNDNTFANKIRNSISTKLAKSLNTTDKIDNYINFRFDLFQLPFNDFSSKSSTHPIVFDLSDQASKWAMIFSLDNMWMSSQSNMYKPLAFNSHSLQLLLTVLSIAEWSYLWGLEKDSNGRVYGGLSFEASSSSSGSLSSFDPREQGNITPKVLSGKYQISYPASKGDIDLAVKIKEIWQRFAADIDIDEQSRLLAAAALAYSRLKPSARNYLTSRFFDKNVGILPDESYQLPLIFLISVGNLLDKYYIDQDNLNINQFVVLTNSSSNINSQKASLQSLARLARGLSLWIEQLQDISKDRLPSNIAEEINKSLPKLKDALRFTILDIFGRYVVINSNTQLQDIAFSYSKYAYELVKFSEVAEALAIMSHVFFKILSTPDSESDYHYRLIGLFHYFAAEYLANIDMNLDAEDIFWGYIALKSFKKYDSNLINAIWLDDALRNLEAAIKNWEQSL